MTRNSQDDLFIAYQLFIAYIDFLEKRLNTQTNIIQHTYKELPLELLSAESREYIQENGNGHIQSSEEFKDTLENIRKEIIQLYQKYPVTISLFARSDYQKNLNAHQMIVCNRFNELRKYGGSCVS